MIAFEVHLNGEKLCTAGIGEPGVLFCIVTWVLREGDVRPGEKEALGLQLGGLISRTQQNLDWLHRPLRDGDEVSIRIVDTDKTDTPRMRPVESPVKRRRQQKAYVRRLAKEFGWKIQTK